jgi:GT2 family glycosyltransferase
MSERVSVVVVNYQGEAYLPEALAAVRGLEGGAVDEVLVVDNASTDGSRALLAERFPDVRVIALAANEGPCAARNAGMRAARNRWVLALDNDAVVRPDLLVKLLAARAEGVAIVQPRSVFHDEPARVHYDGGGFHYAGLIALRNFYVPLADAEGRGTVPVDCAISVALLVDRDALLAAGGYDPRYFILFEDLDLSYRLRARGHAILSVEDAIVEHKGGTRGISFRGGSDYPASRVFLHARNRWMFLARNYAGRTLVAALPGLLLYELASAGFALAAGAPGEWWRGKREARRMWSTLRAELAAERAARRVGDRALLAGGPLALTPAVAGSALRRGVARGLDVLLRAWWALGRAFARP